MQDVHLMGGGTANENGSTFSYLPSIHGAQQRSNIPQKQQNRSSEMKQAQTSRQRINGAKTGKGIPLLMASNYRKEHLSNTDYASASQGGIKIADMIRAREFIKETR